MDKEAFYQHMVACFARDAFEEPVQTLALELRDRRGQTLETLEYVFTKVEGKLRMSLLEGLVKDGGADLIPFFINSIRSEKNILYAKTQILLLKEFHHQRALAALLSLERDIDPELKSTFQRTLGRLLSQFSEQYYMSEFQAGIGDRRRVQFAADMMLRSPHPDYVPFLCERVLENDTGYRTEGLRVLRAIGNETTNEALFGLLAKLRRQQAHARAFAAALDHPRDDLEAFFNQLVAAAGTGWNEAETRRYLAAFKRGEVEDALTQILDGYRLAGDVRKKVKPFLKGILCGGEPSTFQVGRARAAVHDHLEELDALPAQTAATMGEIAQRAGDTQFLERLEHYLPGEDADRDGLIIASLSGYRNAGSEALLAEYVNTCSEPEILMGALNALEAYQPDEVPRGIEKLCFDPDNGPLRQRAVDLMARWGHGSRIARRLMDDDVLAVRADGVRLVAEYRLEDCYNRLLHLLKRDIPDSLLTAVIEALRAFPRFETGRALKPFLQTDHTLTVRTAALHACFRAGGEERMELLLRTFAQQPPTKKDELLDLFLNLVLTETWEDRELFLMRERDFWLSRFIPENEALWPKLLQLIEGLPLGENIQARAWLTGLKKITARFPKGDLDPLQRRVLTLTAHLEQDVQRMTEMEKAGKQLHQMLKALDTRNPYQRTQAMRALARTFPHDAVVGNPEAVRRILLVVGEEFARKDAAKDTLLQAVALAGCLRHPRLLPQLRALQEYPNIDVRAAAREAFEAGADSRFTTPVRSAFIMDDSRYITKQLAKVLAREGFEVDYENDVDAGLKKLSARRFDLLILDVLMPRKSGAAFLREARRLGCAPEFTLVITSSRAREELSPVMAVGVDGLLLKPFRMEEMMARIAEMVPGGTLPREAPEAPSEG